MDSLFSVLMLIAVGIVLLAVPLVWLAVREVGKSYRMFHELAVRYSGRVTKLPFGAVIGLEEGREARIYVLQGTINYVLRINLMSNPDVLLVRRPKYLQALSVPRCGLKRRQILFQELFDEAYTLHAADEEWARQIFDAELRDRLAKEGRVVRLIVRGRKISALTMIWRHSEAEERLLYETVDLLNALAIKILRSGLTVSD
ncbi:MAG: hypothetical protein KC900_08505 [Candidatus Omnitrophica bacterium]|nr:hypothetical protein [Candidatus Omnitrophota bacterium]